MKKILLLAIFASLIYTVSSCNKDTDFLEDADCANVDSATNTYTTNIKNIVDTYCAYSGCHDATTQASGINLSDYSATKNVFENGDGLCTINHGSGCEPMPLNGSKLASDVINDIECWISNGYTE